MYFLSSLSYLLIVKYLFCSKSQHSYMRIPFTKLKEVLRLIWKPKNASTMIMWLGQ